MLLGLQLLAQQYRLLHLLLCLVYSCLERSLLLVQCCLLILHRLSLLLLEFLLFINLLTLVGQQVLVYALFRSLLLDVLIVRVVLQRLLLRRLHIML